MASQTQTFRTVGPCCNQHPTADSIAYSLRGLLVFLSGIAHCRYLKTVRTHLASLILPMRPTQKLPDDVENGVTEAVFDRLCAKGQVCYISYILYTCHIYHIPVY